MTWCSVGWCLVSSCLIWRGAFGDCVGRFFLFFLTSPMLLQGEPYAEFKEEWDDYLDRVPPLADAIRLVNTQSEIIEEVRIHGGLS